tara:strand:+ start:9479 stop:10177 length:699 start_codon:yes stop_codon:yes gene_type:complete
MIGKQSKVSALHFTTVSLVIFLLLNIIAMLMYPGTTYHDHAVQGYSFGLNFFSDLGRTVTYSGESNYISSFIFNMSLVIIGLGLLSFCMVSSIIFNANKVSDISAKLASLCGVISGIALAGVGFTPDNLYHSSHMFFVNTGFRMFLVTIIFLTVAIWTNKDGIPKKLAFANIGFGVLLAIYIGIMEWGPSIETSDGLIFQVVAQKIIVYALVVCVLIQSWGVLKVLKKKVNL